MVRPQANAKWLRGLVVWVFIGVGAMVSTDLAFGQGCAMCYNNAAASGARAIQALKSGILVLLVPPVLMFIGIFVLLFRSKERSGEDLPMAEPGPDAWFGRPVAVDRRE